MEKMTLRNLKLDDEEIDGIAFSINGDDGDELDWEFTMMKLNNDEDRKDFVKHEMGYKYQIVLYEGDQFDMFEAILGDLQYYVKNLVRGNTEGLILKKSKKTQEIIDKMFKSKMVDRFKSQLIEIADKKS
jgi:hypothetical protein